MKTNNNISIKYVSVAGMIAALYVALTALSALFGLSSGAIQVRISEALCVLPIYTTAAIPGLTIGCLIANIIVGGTVFDIIFGTLATLIGALLAYAIRRFKYFAFIPTVLANMIIVPAVIILSGGGGWLMFPYFALTVGLGEIIACGVLGDLLVWYFEKHPSVQTVIFNGIKVKNK
ncbi:MAG: QueT transporter family protein [Clostridiales bacterium]|nr:QueT transporter family protein [Clostridiales bacterium]